MRNTITILFIDNMNYLYNTVMFFALIFVAKGVYDIYWTGERAHLNGTFTIRYLLPLLCALLLLPYIYKII